MAGSGRPADGTLSDAVSAAADLPGRAGPALLEQAGAAYTGSFALMSLVAAVLVTAAAVPAWQVLRPTPRAVDAGAPEPSVMVDAAVTRDPHRSVLVGGTDPQ